MARTFRLRHAAPKGYVVRDDGRVYNRDCCLTGRAQVRATRWRLPGHCACWRCTSVVWGPRWSARERKAQRKAHYRLYRVRSKLLVRIGRWEEVPRFRRTSGWLTW